MASHFLPYFIISLFVAFLGIIPLLVRRYPWRYNCALYAQGLIIGIAVLSSDLSTAHWWAQGVLTAVALSLPLLILPTGRKAYPWYVAWPNCAILGFVFALIRHSLPDIARFFSTAA